MINILLSTYNGEKYLKEQLESIIKQSHSDWTLYIRDDGSTDNTISIIDEYCSRYPNKIVKYEDCLGNIGSLHSFEELLKQAKSDYFMFCDQDDVWLPQKIEKAMSEMVICENANPATPVIVCSDLIVVDEHLNKLSGSFWSYSKIAPQYLQKTNQLAVNNYVTGCTMLFNKKAKDVSLPLGKNAIMHDSWIALKIKASNGIISVLKEPYILYRQHGLNQIGAISINHNIKYFLGKIMAVKKVIRNNYIIFKQSNEILGISLLCFFYNRIIYLIKR